MKFKALITALLCALLGAWYLASSVGFDIHRDHHCGSVYVVSLLHGISCEDIHPEDAGHHCHHHGCESGHHDCSCCGNGHETEKPCEDCSDELEQLSVLCEAPSGGIVLSVPVQDIIGPVSYTVPATLIKRHAAPLFHNTAPPSGNRPLNVVLRA